MSGSCCAGEALRPSSNAAAAVRCCCCCSSSISTPPAPSKTATTRIASRATAASQILRSSALTAPAAAASEPSMSGADASRRERAVSSTGAGTPASAERSSKLLLGDGDDIDIQALVSFPLFFFFRWSVVRLLRPPEKESGRANGLSLCGVSDGRAVSREFECGGKRKTVTGRVKERKARKEGKIVDGVKFSGPLGAPGKALHFSFFSSTSTSLFLSFSLFFFYSLSLLSLSSTLFPYSLAERKGSGPSHAEGNFSNARELGESNERKRKREREGLPSSSFPPLFLPPLPLSPLSQPSSALFSFSLLFLRNVDIFLLTLLDL